jgi:CspA family cold shock protein
MQAPTRTAALIGSMALAGALLLAGCGPSTTAADPVAAASAVPSAPAAPTVPVPTAPAPSAPVPSGPAETPAAPIGSTWTCVRDGDEVTCTCEGTKAACKASATKPNQTKGYGVVGRVRWFDDAKGYGFIIPEGGGEDIFVHFSEINGSQTLFEGECVMFEVMPGVKGGQAAYVNYC